MLCVNYWQKNNTDMNSFHICLHKECVIYFSLMVLLPMISEVILPPEGLPTDVAGEGALICVCPLVDQQVVRLGKLTVAESADVLFLWSIFSKKHNKNSKYM